MIINDTLHLWTYSSKCYSVLRFGANMLFITSVAYGISGYSFVLLLAALLLPVVLKLHSISFMNEKGVFWYRYFFLRTYLPWQEIEYYGTIRRKVLGENLTYIYFSKTPCSYAPFEKLPTSSRNVHFFTYHDDIPPFVAIQTKGRIKIHHVKTAEKEAQRTRKFPAVILLYLVCFLLLYVVTHLPLFLFGFELVVLLAGVWAFIGICRLSKK